MNNPETSVIIRKQIAIRNYLCSTEQEEVSEIIVGLSAQQKYIPSKFFYDANGSKLFEDITCLPEYYPTRTEKALLKEIAPQISKAVRNIDIVELGSGDCSKISILLDAIPFEIWQLCVTFRLILVMLPFQNQQEYWSKDSRKLQYMACLPISLSISVLSRRKRNGYFVFLAARWET